MLGPAYTGLSIWGAPGPELVPEFDKLALVDTQSITYGTESGAVLFNITPITATPDTWGVKWDDSRFGEYLDIPYWYTDLGLTGGPGAPQAYSDKPAPFIFQAITTDTWFAQWNESPFDTVQLDMFDFFGVKFGTELAAIVTSQTFPATEFWNITFAEASTVAQTNAELDLSLNDPWGIKWNDASLIEKDITTTETWSLMWNDVSFLLNLAAVTDTYSITYSPETSAVATGAPTVVDTTDNWNIQWQDNSSLVQNLFPAVAENWNIHFQDAGAVTFDTRDTSEQWQISWDEVSDVQPDTKSSDLVDGWNLAHQFEIATVANIPTISIVASDEWKLTFAESTFLFSSLIQVPKGRRILVGRNRRVIKVWQ